jgi:site-specific recombinase XerD
MSEPAKIITAQEMLVARRTRREGRKRAELVREGSVTVRIFTIREAGRKPRFEVRYHFAGQLKRKKFPTRAEAQEFAQAQAAKIDSGKTIGANLTSADEQCYLRLLQRLQQHEQRTGNHAHSEAVLDELCGASETLHASGLSLSEAVQLAIKFNPRALTSKNIPAVVEEFLANLKAKAIREKSSLGHWRNLRAILNRFAAAFTGPISTVLLADVASWLTKLELKTKAWNDHRAAIVQLARYAATRRYAGKQLVDDLAALQRFEVPAVKSNPYTPQEVRTVLEFAQASEDYARLIPYIVLVGFCGFRSSEVRGEKGAAEVGDIDFERREAKVWVGHSKVSEDRFTALPDNAVEWLKIYAPKSGLLCPFAKPYEKFTELCQAAGVPRKRNGLRKGFISHRCAVTGDIVKVSDEAGTSEEKIKSNYLRRPPKHVGEEYFRISPRDPQLQLFASPKRPHTLTRSEKAQKSQ